MTYWTDFQKSFRFQFKNTFECLVRFSRLLKVTAFSLAILNLNQRLLRVHLLKKDFCKISKAKK